MEDRLAAIESRLAEIERRLAAIEKSPAAATTAVSEAPEPSLGEGLLADAPVHIGQVLLIFGGAYLLRAITDYQFVATALGLGMGAAYALFWLLMAWRRKDVASQRASAVFYSATSVLLALPLLVEAVSRFQLLSGTQGVIALALYSAAAMFVAAVANLRSLGWLVCAGGIVTGVAIIVVAQAAVAVSAFLLAFGIAVLWVVYWRQWLALQWFAGFGAIAGVAVLVVLGDSEQWQLDPRTAAWFGTVLLIAFLVSFAIRSHVKGRELGTFEMVQALTTAAVTYWATAAAVGAGVGSIAFAGAFGMLLGAVAYALAFTPQTRERRGRNFFAWLTLGMVFVIAGSALLLEGDQAAVLWSVMAIVTAWLSGRTGRVALSLQCTILLLAAAFGSGILATGLTALVSDASSGWPALNAWHVGVALTTVACLFIPVAQHSERWGTLAGLPQLIVLALSVWEVGGLMVVVFAPVIAATTGDEPNLAALASLRTAILSAASVTLALSSRFRRWPEARWLVYPLLILVAVKLFVEDFPNGQPASLFVALFFVGSALLAVARLLKGAGGPEDSFPSSQVQASR
jgi:hypothetical protein